MPQFEEKNSSSFRNCGSQEIVYIYYLYIIVHMSPCSACRVYHVILAVGGSTFSTTPSMLYTISRAVEGYLLHTRGGNNIPGPGVGTIYQGREQYTRNGNNKPGPRVGTIYQGWEQYTRDGNNIPGMGIMYQGWKLHARSGNNIPGAGTIYQGWEQ